MNLEFKFQIPDSKFQFHYPFTMIKNTFPGKFIVIEGIDGSGKSTQAAMAVDYFDKKGAAVCFTSEPTRLRVGEIIRARLLGEWEASPATLQLLFAADRANHLEQEIRPRLKEGGSVVCDRYFLSSLAYGAVDCDFDWLAGVNGIFLIPDLTIFLDIDAETGVDRIAANGKSIELFEKSEILEKVRRNYDTAINVFKKEMAIEIVDGKRSKEAVFEDVKNIIGKII